MKFPAALLSAKAFAELGSLQSHEDLRERGLLIFHDNLHDMIHSTARLIFFSHQWTSFALPDPSGTQYEAMLSALRHIVHNEQWDIHATWVWVDYFVRQAGSEPTHLEPHDLGEWSEI